MEGVADANTESTVFESVNAAWSVSFWGKMAILGRGKRSSRPDRQHAPGMRSPEHSGGLFYQ